MIQRKDVVTAGRVLGGVLAAVLVRFGQCGLMVLKQLGWCLMRVLRWQRKKSIKALVTPVFILWGMLLMYQTYILYNHERYSADSSVSALIQKQQIDRIIDAKVNERLHQQNQEGTSLQQAFQAFADSRPTSSTADDAYNSDEDEDDAALVNADTLDLVSDRSAHKFIIIQPIESIITRKSKKHKRRHADVALISDEQQGNVDVVVAALKQLGYQQASGLSDGGLMWIIAIHLECTDPAVTTAMNSIPGATASLVLLCAGGPNFVDHFNRKDVAVQRLEWYDHKLQCPLYHTIVPTSFVVNARSDLRELEASARSSRHWIIKAQMGESRSLPSVTRKVVSSVKHLRRTHGEGLVAQQYIEHPLLWQGKKLSLRVFAWVISSHPLRVLYHDGFVLRSLESYARPRKKFGRQANITTQQEGHDGEMGARFGCFDGLQEQISAFARSDEASHYVELVLKPYLKRLIVYMIYAMKRDHVQDVPTLAAHHLCFDFVIDQDWNVYLVDMRNRCALQFGELAYSSTCKTTLLKAFGSGAMRIMEAVHSGRKMSKIGSFEPMIDETTGGWDPHSYICKRKLYQDFIRRQTRSKRVVMNLFHPQGLPQQISPKDAGMDRNGAPWQCPVCSYPNAAAAHFCDNCGSSSDPTIAVTHEDHAQLHSTQPGHSHEGDDLAHEHEAKLEAEFAALLASSSSSNTVMSNSPSKHEVAERSLECSGKPFVIHENAEIIGGNLEPLRAMDVTGCCVACAGHHGCIAFSFNPSTSQCWLKAERGAEGHRLGAISGSAGSSTSAVATNAATTTTALHPHEHVSRAYYKERLVDLFKRYDPAKLPRVDVLLDRYRGNEERYVLRTMQQYKAMEAHNRERSADHEKDKRGVKKAEYVDRLTHLFAKHDPEMIPHIDDMLQRFQGHEMELLQFMVKKYA